MLVKGVQVLIIATLLLYSTCERSPHTRGYVTADGSQCTWFDLRKGQTEVALATACVCKDANGRSQSYGCQYSAELYKCDEFVDNSKAVFSDLVSRLSALNNSCELDTLSVSKCDDMILQREHLHKTAKPCVPHPLEDKEEL